MITASMLWDMLPAEAVIPLCPEAGVTPPDADGAAFELARSQARRGVIGPLLPWIEVLSAIAAEIESIAMVRPAGPLPHDAEALQQERDLYAMKAHDILLPGACAIISMLVDRGFLQVTDRGRAGTLSAFTGDGP